MVITVLKQEQAIEIISEMDKPFRSDIGVAMVTVGYHPTKGWVTVVVGMNGEAVITSGV